MPADNLVPLTKLEAVNLMLDSIGEQPVSALDTPQVTEVSTAVRILDRISRAVQERGCQFNTEYNYKLLPTAGEYVVPLNTARITTDQLQANGALDVTLRGNKLYDLTNHTTVFTQPSLQVTIIFYLNFEDLPAYARNYIAIKAGRQFQDSVLGSQVYHAYTEQDEVYAHAAFIRGENLNGKYTIFGTPTFQRAVNRRIVGPF